MVEAATKLLKDYEDRGSKIRVPLQLKTVYTDFDSAQDRLLLPNLENYSAKYTAAMQATKRPAVSMASFVRSIGMSESGPVS